MMNYNELNDFFNVFPVQASGDRLGQMKITPDIANELLQLNFIDQRPISKSNIESLRRHMRNNTFLENHTNIILCRNVNDKTYTLLDGQHRMRALKDEQATFSFNIQIQDVHSEQEMRIKYATTDQGAKRTVKAGIKALGGLDKNLSCAIKGILDLPNSKFKNPSPQEVYALSKNYQFEYGQVKHIITRVFSASGKTITDPIIGSLLRKPILVMLLLAFKQNMQYTNILENVVSTDLVHLNKTERHMREFLCTKYKDHGSHGDQMKKMYYLLKALKNNTNVSRKKFDAEWNDVKLNELEF
jgi:hypothetical protein